ncbi:nuclease domain-containing protein [Hoeflea sp.]|uniref:nuclease domain-containing protein n=1 Tax=Hoeflea sp. TaxID=1940281 RepID=UPI0019A4CCD3|nr:nuclease domain-containing protein [Hoeflea sp.]MBC7282600.1 DUF1364 family protein [Hoeflea sp.]
MNLTGRSIPQKGQKPAKSATMRRASSGATCTLRVACGKIVPSLDVVGCHARFFNFAGTAQKVDDLFIIDGCPSCHHVLDNRTLWVKWCLEWDDVLRALMESQMRRRAAGVIILKGE